MDKRHRSKHSEIYGLAKEQSPITRSRMSGSQKLAESRKCSELQVSETWEHRWELQGTQKRQTEIPVINVKVPRIRVSPYFREKYLRGDNIGVSHNRRERSSPLHKSSIASRHELANTESRTPQVQFVPLLQPLHHHYLNRSMEKALAGAKRVEDMLLIKLKYKKLLERYKFQVQQSQEVLSHVQKQQEKIAKLRDDTLELSS